MAVFDGFFVYAPVWVIKDTPDRVLPVNTKVRLLGMTLK